MGRGKKYIPKSFESSRGDKDTFAAIYMSMVESVAWQELSKPQRELYRCMKHEHHNSRNRPVKSDLLCFCFNWTMYSQKYKLGKNKQQFAKDKDALIERGFITCEEPGANTHTNAVFRFSDRWQRYGKPGYDIDRRKISVSLNNKLNKQEKS